MVEAGPFRFGNFRTDTLVTSEITSYSDYREYNELWPKTGRSLIKLVMLNFTKGASEKVKFVWGEATTKDE